MKHNLELKLKHKLKHKIVRRNISNPRYAGDTTLMAESEEELKCFWMKVEEKSEKCWLNAQHSENQDHSSGPISSHQFHLVPGPIDGETVETVTDSLAGGLENHCRW